MVKVMEKLQLYRSSQQVFSGKESIVTVRDLIKWAKRVNAAEQTMENFALEGYFVLAERSRSKEDQAFIRDTVENAIGVKLEVEVYYENYFETQIRQQIKSK